MSLQEQTASGLAALDLATQLLRRVRLAHPTAGLWEAADVQWWWRTPRASDHVDQVFWLDDQGPVTAVLLTDWQRTWGCDPIVLPGTPAGIQNLAWSRGLERIEALALDGVEVLVRDDDAVLSQLVVAAGFAPTGEHGAAMWLPTPDRPRVPPLPDGFELLDRGHTQEGPHHLVPRSGPTVEARLRQTSLYDPELDLAVRAPSGDIAAYGLFWFDPVTAVGLVEPMRTEDRYQRLGLARTLLAAGLDRLARRGATRLKVSYESVAARGLYLGAGFRVESTDTNYARPGR